MNPDPKHNDCSIPEEEEEDPDARLRAHLRLWARRLRGAEEAEVRLPLPHGTRAARRHRPVGEQVNAHTPPPHTHTHLPIAAAHKTSPSIFLSFFLPLHPGKT